MYVDGHSIWALADTPAGSIRLGQHGQAGVHEWHFCPCMWLMCTWACPSRSGETGCFPGDYVPPLPPSPEGIRARWLTSRPQSDQEGEIS